MMVRARSRSGATGRGFERGKIDVLANNAAAARVVPFCAVCARRQPDAIDQWEQAGVTAVA